MNDDKKLTPTRTSEKVSKEKSRSKQVIPINHLKELDDILENTDVASATNLKQYVKTLAKILKDIIKH